MTAQVVLNGVVTGMVVALPAVALTVLAHSGVRRGLRGLAVTLAVVAGIVAAVLEHVRHGMAYGDPPPFALSHLHAALPPTLVSAYLTLGLAVSPLTLWVALRLRGRDLISPGRLAGWAVGVVAAIDAGVLHRGVRLILRNHLDATGAYWDAMVGGKVLALNPRVWQIVQYLAALGAILLAGEIGAALARPARLLHRLAAGDPARTAVVVFAILQAAVIALLSLTGQEQWDRYLLILVPCTGICLLQPTVAAPGRSRLLATTAPVAAATATAVLIGAVCWYMAAYADARDGMVWTAAQDLVNRGVDPRDINAGLDWDGYHALTPADKRTAGSGRHYEYRGQRWAALFTGTRDCWLVSLTPQLDVPAQIDTVRRAPLYVSHPIPVYVLHRAGCP
jgi:hypothetical protein